MSAFSPVPKLDVVAGVLDSVERRRLRGVDLVIVRATEGRRRGCAGAGSRPDRRAGLLLGSGAPVGGQRLALRSARGSVGVVLRGVLHVALRSVDEHASPVSVDASDHTGRYHDRPAEDPRSRIDDQVGVAGPVDDISDFADASVPSHPSSTLRATAYEPLLPMSYPAQLAAAPQRVRSATPVTPFGQPRSDSGAASNRLVGREAEWRGLARHSARTASAFGPRVRAGRSPWVATPSDSIPEERSRPWLVS